MPGETLIENGTQEVVAEVKQEVAAVVKQEVAAEVPVPEVKQEEPEVKEDVPEVAQETVPEVTQEVAPEVEKEVVPEIKEVVPEIKEVVPEIKEVVPEVVPEIKEVVPEIKQEIVPEPEVKQAPIIAPAVQQNGILKKQEEAPIEPTIHQNGAPKKNSTMSTSMDVDSVRAAYDDVRADNSETQWAVLKFNGARIVSSATGADFAKFKEQFSDNERAFGYIRIQTGDEMSKRQKFLLVTWVGPLVSVLQRAKMSTDKAVVKNVISNFAVELQLENTSEIDLKHFVAELNKAGGANYGTGVREI